MAYETGVASTPADLLTKLCTFAAANGWTQHTCLTGRALSKGTVVVGLNGDADSLDTRPATAVDTGLDWNAQPNNSAWSHVCNIGAGPYTAYHFYTAVEDSKDLLWAVIEISAGIYRHWMVCDLVKFGTWTGGTYTDSQYHNTGGTYFDQPDSSYHRYICDAFGNNSGSNGTCWCDVDGLTNNWFRIDNATVTTAGTRGTGVQRTYGKALSYDNIQYQRWNLRTPLWPMEVFVNRPSNLKSMAGRVPGARIINLRNHSVGEILSIGGDNWQLWPAVARTDTIGGGINTSTGYYGYAIKR